ncbi:MAG TPA: ATP-binding cassette domain-containing protein [Flavipsychrobacter sp.]|nr:ATP-binding cassette domain-containing protein [Flavipsychrobacter sp.]
MASSLKKFQEILKYEKEEISSIYFYAILMGLLQLSVPLGIQSIISFVLGGSISTSIVLLIIFVVVGVLINGKLHVNQMKIIEKIQQQLFVRYSFQYAHSIPKLDLRNADSYYLPELVNRFFDTISLQKGISKILLEVPAAMLQMIFGLILLSFYHPVFILFGALLMLVVFMILRFSGRRGFQTSLEESTHKYKVAAYLQELARAVISFKFSKNGSLHLQKTDGYVQRYLQSRTEHFKILLFQYWTLIGFKVAITAAMLIVGAVLLVNQQLNIGQFIAAEIVIIMVINSVEKLVLNLEQVYDVMTSLEKISKLTDKKKEEESHQQLDASNGISLSLKDVSFGFTDDKSVLKNISLELKAGEKVCVMGVHSAGKSTLLRFLTGSYRPYQGSFSINGLSANSYDVRSLRAHTGIVLYQQEIFEGTLLENILMNSDTSRLAEVQQLAAIVGLQNFIEHSPEGYDMQVKNNGQHLAGKIVKKILLLRALVNQPKLLLLEEPWTGLETEDATRIKNYLLHETKEITTVLISNDETVAAACDKVVFLENGIIKAAGTWQEVNQLIS